LSQKLEVLIAGAGIGGLTLALALARRGITVRVLEQSEELNELGAGIQISANASRILHTMALESELAKVGFFPEEGQMRHWQTGAVVGSRSLGRESVERYGFPYYHLHRADFQQILGTALREAQPDALVLGARVENTTQNARSVTVHTANGDSFSGDVLIGCDGIHSRVRDAIIGPQEPEFTRTMAWRATVPAARLPEGLVRPVASNWLGPGGHFVHYYIRAGELVNCVGARDCDEWIKESWFEPGDPDQMRADFAGWHSDLQQLMGEITECFRWGLFDRKPLKRWSFGRISLLGDACHAMLPFMAQGAVMSIEDAWVLSRLLSGSPAHVEAALLRYQSMRMNRTAIVQGMSRDNIKLFHNPDQADPSRLTQHRANHEWLYGYDADNVALWSGTLAPVS
jgi:salicylate hydroxylase